MQLTRDLFAIAKFLLVYLMLSHEDMTSIEVDKTIQSIKLTFHSFTVKTVFHFVFKFFCLLYYIMLFINKLNFELM